MKKTFLYTVLILAFSISAKAQENYYKPKYSTTLKKAKAEKILWQPSRNHPVEIAEYWQPRKSDIAKLELNFKKILSITSDSCCGSKAKVENLDLFVFQYASVIYNNKKYIYINTFAIPTPYEINKFYKYWKRNPVIVYDGGKYHWGILFNIEDLEFEQLAFNGSA